MNTWLSTKQAAELWGYSERAVRKKAKNSECTYRYIPSSTGQGGKRMEILLESLPEQAQKAYHNEHGGEFQPVFNTDYASTKAQKEKGELRALAVTEYRKFLRQSQKAGMESKTEIMDLFIKQWNVEHDFRISRKSLYDWMKISRSGNVERLIDKRGGHNRGQSSIPEKYKELFNSLYLQQTKPTIESCFREVKREANINSDCIPGIKAFRNHVANLKPAVLILAREGKKAFEDKCLPHIERDYSQMEPNEMWVSDHHLWDIFVRVPDGKGGWKKERPWGTYWMDMRTRKIMASVIRIESPNADVVLYSFGLGIKEFGIPKRVLLDNGKDYKARDMFYPKGHHEDESNKVYSSLASNLQIEVTYAHPYNAKAKPIERVFNTFEEQLGKKYPSYAGRNAKQRPEDSKELDIMDIITLEDFIKHHYIYVYQIYNETAHFGNAMQGKSPNQIYADIPFIPREAPKGTLFFSLMRVKGQRTVQKNGVTFQGVHFHNDQCGKYFGQKVTARYDPEEPQILYIFDTDENFLFQAVAVQKQVFSPTSEDYQKENQRKKRAKQEILGSYTTNSAVRSTKAIGERLKKQAQGIEPTEMTKSNVVEMVRNEKLEENSRRISMSELDRNYEDILKKNEANKKAASDRQKELADKFKKKMLDRAYQNQA